MMSARTVAAAGFVLLLATVALGASLVLVSAQAGDQGSPVALGGVDMEEVSDAGLVLRSPGDQEPAVSVDAALKVAESEMVAGGVREVVLADLKEDAGGVGGLVWVVNYDPLTIPVAVFSEVDHITSYVTVVDANTGDYLYTLATGDTCDRAAVHDFYSSVIEPVCSGEIIPGAPPTE